MSLEGISNGPAFTVSRVRLPASTTKPDRQSTDKILAAAYNEMVKAYGKPAFRGKTMPELNNSAVRADRVPLAVLVNHLDLQGQLTPPVATKLGYNPRMDPVDMARKGAKATLATYPVAYNLLWMAMGYMADPDAAAATKLVRGPREKPRKPRTVNPEAMAKACENKILDVIVTCAVEILGRPKAHLKDATDTDTTLQRATVMMVYEHTVGEEPLGGGLTTEAVLKAYFKFEAASPMAFMAHKERMTSAGFLAYVQEDNRFERLLKMVTEHPAYLALVAQRDEDEE